ncbi:MAG: dinitrogenase iron-molybdenum cofactor biosynthesis protein [Phycisphaerae bacterium]|nr:dinitrogenase iron-molybdenum cofactor biosynthesis protein [Phycisphaerae bacterium]
MKAAFTTWRNRIAPVFDVAGEVVLVEVDQENNVVSTLMSLPVGPVEAKVQRLSEQGVKVLVCGAMSRAAQKLAQSEMVEVYSFVAGDTNCVIEAWLQGCLAQTDFAMPGCAHRRHRRCRYRGENRQ